jgi:hypothetical protein
MRTIVTCAGLITTIAVVILIHSCVISRNVRDNEVASALDTASEYALEIVPEIYSKWDYDPAKQGEYIDQLMNRFCAAVKERTGTDGTITISLIYADFETGLFDVVVKEEYEYPLMSKKGSCYCEKVFRIE